MLIAEEVEKVISIALVLIIYVNNLLVLLKHQIVVIVALQNQLQAEKAEVAVAQAEQENLLE